MILDSFFLQTPRSLELVASLHQLVYWLTMSTLRFTITLYPLTTYFLNMKKKLDFESTKIEELNLAQDFDSWLEQHVSIKRTHIVLCICFTSARNLSWRRSDVIRDGTKHTIHGCNQLLCCGAHAWHVVMAAYGRNTLRRKCLSFFLKGSLSNGILPSHTPLVKLAGFIWPCITGFEF